MDACEKYAAAVKTRPDFHQALNNWGNIFLAQARGKKGAEEERLFEEAQEKFMFAEAIAPGSGSYNLACIYSLRGEDDKCGEWLLNSHSHRELPPRKVLESDTDLDNVRQSDWFQALLAEL